MRILAPTVLLPLLLSTGAGSVLAQESQARALIIGITGYPEFEPEDSLKYADDDALAFYDFIRTPEGGAFQEENIQLLLNEEATRDAILQAMEELKNTGLDDVLYVFFAGHGVTDDSDRAYLMPYHADDDRPAGLGFRADEFIRMIQEAANPRHLVFFIDACHAGATFGGGLARGGNDNASEGIRRAWKEARLDEVPSNMAFLSARNSQRSWEDDELRHGVFSYYLLEGLRGAADAPPTGDDDGAVTAHELNKYLMEEVEKHVDRMNGRDQWPTTTHSFVGTLQLSRLQDRVDLNTGNAAEAFVLGFELAAAGDTAAAIDAYRRAIELDATFAAAYNNLGNLVFADTDSAIALYERAVAADPGYATAFYNLGVALVRVGRRNDAISVYESAARLEPDNADVHNNLGVAVRDEGDVDRAIEEFRDAMRIDSLHPYASRNLGNALLRIGDLKGAVEALRKAVEVYPGGRTTVSGELSTAEEQLASLEANVALTRDSVRTHPERWHDLSFLLHEKVHDFQGAYEILEEQTRLDPQNLSAHVEFAEASLTSRHFEQANSMIDELLARDDLSASWEIVLRALRIAVLEALNRSYRVPTALAELRATMAAQPDSFDLGWQFTGTKYFTRTHESLRGRRTFLLELFDALERGVRDEVLSALPAPPASRELSWIQCQGDEWCGLFRVDLEHAHFDGLEGVYIVWRGSEDPVPLRVGRGQIRNALQALRQEGPFLARRSEGVFVTWATVAPADQRPIQKYLNDTLSPELVQRVLARDRISVNLPW